MKRIEKKDQQWVSFFMKNWRKFMIISTSLFDFRFCIFDQKQASERCLLFLLIWKWFEKSDRLFSTSNVIYLYEIPSKSALAFTSAHQIRFRFDCGHYGIEYIFYILFQRLIGIDSKFHFIIKIAKNHPSKMIWK